MKILVTLFTILILLSCYSPQKETTETNSRMELLPEPDKNLRKAYEEAHNLPTAASAPDSSYVANWCSTKILGITYDSIDNLSLLHVSDLLESIHKSCHNNIEFSEWSNELLFGVTARRPELVCQALAKKPSLDREQIIFMYAHPIHDGFDLGDILRKVSSIDITEDEDTANWKKRMLNAIEEARKSYQ